MFVQFMNNNRCPIFVCSWNRVSDVNADKVRRNRHSTRQNHVELLGLLG